MTHDTSPGFLIINKPIDITSFDCIRHIKKILKQKIKIGHTGTLDDFATGLLIICIGKEATKFSNTLLNLDKEYIVKAKLGELTDTLDLTGKIIEQKNALKITKANLQKAIEKLGKSYMQIPPIYSALKYKGKPLYKLIRGKKLNKKKLEEIVKQKARKITIHKIKLIDFDYPFFTIKTIVSKGCYIRSLANDIAQILKVPATTYELTRTKIGKIDLKNAINLINIKTVLNIKNNLISPEKLLEIK